MKNRYKLSFKWLVGIATCSGVLLTSCNDYLDITPPSDIPPELYLNEENELATYVNGLYGILPSHGGIYTYGIFGGDAGTDNMVKSKADSKYIGNLHTGMDNGDYYFENIRSCNYFLQEVLPKYASGNLSGNEEYIRHYIGEIYFLRAYEYFKRYQMFGDYPIITKILPDQEEVLIKESKRSPRNEVARFILNNLDMASYLMSGANPDANKTRISEDAAIFLKSRVALFEATWLKYHKEYVPGGDKWPGKDMYPNYTFPAGSYQAEIDYFLRRAYEAADSIAGKYALVQNTGNVQQSASEPSNPYMDMYATEDMKGYSEVIMWRQYSRALSVGHSVGYHAQLMNNGTGTTRGMIESYLMSDGKPIYSSSFTYNDEGIANVRKNRDARINVFLKEPGQVNYFVNLTSNLGSSGQIVEPANPTITGDTKNPTGYMLRMGNSKDKEENDQYGTFLGSPVFMAAEAYLNYIEARYLASGDWHTDKIEQYWNELRQKHALITASIQETIDATDMAKETALKDQAYDWGAYSAGAVLSDKVLYCIRRERRCELIGMGMRYMDLCRWRSMDQLKENKYHIEGFKLWGDDGKQLPVYSYKRLPADPDNTKSVVSSPELSNYLRPFEIQRTSDAFSGLGWYYAYYLGYVPIKQFSLCGDGVLYQNPGWSESANSMPEF